MSLRPHNTLSGEPRKWCYALSPPKEFVNEGDLPHQALYRLATMNSMI